MRAALGIFADQLMELPGLFLLIQHQSAASPVQAIPLLQYRESGRISFNNLAIRIDMDTADGHPRHCGRKRLLFRFHVDAHNENIERCS